MTSELYSRIYLVVQRVPQGRVASYSQIAKACGMPRGARIVGWALGTLGPKPEVPWWRVVNAKGELSITNKDVSPEDQAMLLRAEGFSLTWNGGMYVLDSPVWWEPDLG